MDSIKKKMQNLGSETSRAQGRAEQWAVEAAARNGSADTKEEQVQCGIIFTQFTVQYHFCDIGFFITISLRDVFAIFYQVSLYL